MIIAISGPEYKRLYAPAEKIAKQTSNLCQRLEFDTVYFEIEGHTITSYGCNGFCLSKTWIMTTNVVSSKYIIKIPIGCDNKASNVEIDTDMQVIIFDQVTTVKVEVTESYPDVFSTVWPDKYTSEVTLTKKYLADAVSTQNDRVVVLKRFDNGVVIESDSHKHIVLGHRKEGDTDA